MIKITRFTIFIQNPKICYRTFFDMQNLTPHPNPLPKGERE